MDTAINNALKHWALWLGLPYSETDRVVSKYVPSLSIELSRLASLLYQPPHANTVSADFFQARADRCMWRLAKRLGVRPRAFWPQGRPYAICVTHDIDRIFSTFHGAKDLLRSPLRATSRIFSDVRSALLPSRHALNPFYNFDRLIAQEASWGIPSAVYVLFEKRRLLFALTKRELQHLIGVYNPKQIEKQLRLYRNLGNEVGLHASFDSWNDEGALRKELTALKDLGISDPKGIRNHYLCFDRAFTTSALLRNNLHYDSTMGFNFMNGFRCGTGFPFKWGNIWELPFQLMDSAVRFQHRALAEGDSTCDAILGETRRYGGALVLNWHFRVMNPDSCAEDVARLGRVVEQGKRDGAWFTTPSDLIRQWEYRAFEAEEIQTHEPERIEQYAPALSP